MIRIKWLAAVGILLFAVTASADFYKFRDQNGNIVYTDDITRVARGQQAVVSRYREYQPGDVNSGGEALKEEASGRPGGKASGNTKVSQLAPGGTGSGGEGLQTDQDRAAADLAAEKGRLDKRKQELDAEFQLILKDKKLLDRKQVFRNKDAAGVYNSKVSALNQRIENYENRKKVFNAEVENYNQRVKTEIDALNQNK